MKALELKFTSLLEHEFRHTAGHHVIMNMGVAYLKCVFVDRVVSDDT